MTAEASLTRPALNASRTPPISTRWPVQVAGARLTARDQRPERNASAGLEESVK